MKKLLLIPLILLLLAFKSPDVAFTGSYYGIIGFNDYDPETSEVDFCYHAFTMDVDADGTISGQSGSNVSEIPDNLFGAVDEDNNASLIRQRGYGYVFITGHWNYPGGENIGSFNSMTDWANNPYEIVIYLDSD